MDPNDSLVMDQKIDILFQELQDERNARIRLQEQLEEVQQNSHKRNYISDGEDRRLIKVVKHTLEAQAKKKESKISRRAFSFTKYDGRKDARMLLSWLSSLDDYFQDEHFSERDMIKCATNQMTDRATLWWNVIRKSRKRPKTWKKFQRMVKKYFLPSQYKEKARHAWDVLQIRERETVTQYTDRFWQILLSLQNVEKVPRQTFKRKYIAGLDSTIRAEVNKFRPHSLERAISLAHDAETAKKRRFNTKTVDV